MSIYDALPLIRNGLPESLFAADGHQSSSCNKGPPTNTTSNFQCGGHTNTHQPQQAKVTFGDINNATLSDDGTKLTITVRDGLTFNMLSGIADIVWQQRGVVSYTIDNMQDYAEVDRVATVVLTVRPKVESAAQVLARALQQTLDVL